MAVTCSGTIKDPSGTPISNLRIIIRSVGTSVTSLDGTDLIITTDVNGDYSFNLANGVYATYLDYGSEMFVGEFFINDESVDNTLNTYLLTVDLGTAAIAAGIVFQDYIDAAGAEANRAEAAADNIGNVEENVTQLAEQAASSANLAGEYSEAALTARNDAVSAKESAQTYSQEALASKNAAATSETNAGQSATDCAQLKEDVQTLVDSIDITVPELNDAVTAAQTAQEGAETARDETLAALPAVNERIDNLTAADVGAIGTSGQQTLDGDLQVNSLSAVTAITVNEKPVYTEDNRPYTYGINDPDPSVGVEGDLYFKLEV